MSEFTIPSKEVTIGDVDYRVLAFLGTKSVTLVGKVMKIVGPSISEFFNETEDATTNAIKVFSQSLGDQDLAPIVKELLAGVTKEGKAVNLDRDFIGENFAHLPKLLVEVCMFNWGSAFREISI
jgi:hypothetical protein